jgi:hypothetical protein
MGNILIDELHNALISITGLGGSVAAKQLLLIKAIGLTSTGWGGLGLAAGAMAIVAIMGYKAYRGYAKEAKLKAEEVAKIEHFAGLLEQLNREIIDKEKKLNKYRTAASKDSKRGLEFTRIAVKVANELDSLYIGMDELNIANPVSNPVAPPVIENKYFICEDQPDICNKAGKIKSDKIWGDIDDCCVEAPMENVMDRLASVEDKIVTLQDNTYNEIDYLKELISESERSGGSLIRKIKNKSKRNKTKRIKYKKNKITKRKINNIY